MRLIDQDPKHLNDAQWILRVTRIRSKSGLLLLRSSYLPTTYEVRGKVMLSGVSVLLFTRGWSQSTWGHEGWPTPPYSYPPLPVRQEGLWSSMISKSRMISTQAMVSISSDKILKSKAYNQDLDCDNLLQLNCNLDDIGTINTCCIVKTLSLIFKTRIRF